MAAKTSEVTPELAAQWAELEAKTDIDGMYNFVSPHKTSQDPDMLWRVAFAITEKGKLLGGDHRKTYVYEAFGYIKKALELDDTNSNIHKWYGVLLDYTGEYEGNKQRISNSYKCKEHFLKAIELNPSDPILYYCMGFWCFLFADMPWYQRKIAAVVFATPPTSTYEEALKFFEDSEEAGPDVYNQTKVMIAKCLIKTKKDKERAKDMLRRAAAFNAKAADDIKAVEEAKELMKKEFSITL